MWRGPSGIHYFLSRGRTDARELESHRSLFVFIFIFLILKITGGKCTFKVSSKAKNGCY